MNKRILDVACILVVFAILATYGYIVYAFTNYEKDLVDFYTSNINNISKRLNTTLDNLHKSNETIAELREEIYKIKRDNVNLSLENEKLLKFVKEHKTRIPTLYDVRMFMWEDKTNYNTYLVGKYECINFAADVARNASKHGFPVAVCYIRFPRAGHAIVAFNTTSGVVFFDPILDMRVNLTVGEDYYKLNGLYPVTDGRVLYYDCVWLRR